MFYHNSNYLRIVQILKENPYNNDHDINGTPLPPFMNDFLLLDNTNFLLLDGTAFDLLGVF